MNRRSHEGDMWRMSEVGCMSVEGELAESGGFTGMYEVASCGDDTCGE